MPCCPQIFLAALLALYLRHAASHPLLQQPPSGLPTLSRATAWVDVSSSFRLVYSIAPGCAEAIQFPQPTVSDANIATISPSSVVEDGEFCPPADAPFKLVSEATVTDDDDLLSKVGLAAFREAIDANVNVANFLSITARAGASTIVGWHGANRTCNSRTYASTTIYFFIRETGGFTLPLKSGSDQLYINIPTSMPALFILPAQANELCLYVDKEKNAQEDVTLSKNPGTPSAQTTVLTPAGTSPLPSPGSSDPPTPSPSVVAIPPGSTPVPAPVPASTSAPSSTSPSPVVPIAPTPSIEPTPVDSPPAESPTEPPSPDASPPSVTVLATQSPSVSPGSTPPAATASPAPGSGVTGVASPSSTPTSVIAASPNDVDDSSACFPRSARVSLRGRDRGVPVAELAVGDRVRTANGKLSTVVLFTHADRHARVASFRHIVTAAGLVITLSPGHYLPVLRAAPGTTLAKQGAQLVAAAAVRRGDAVLSSRGIPVRVIATHSVCAIGLYNPQTISGELVVNGILTSAYTTAVHPDVAHHVLLPLVRALFSISPTLVHRLSMSFKFGAPLLAALMPSGVSVF